MSPCPPLAPRSARLDRTVAVNVLPEHVNADPQLK